MRAGDAALVSRSTKRGLATHQAGYFFENSVATGLMNRVWHARQRRRSILKAQVAQNPPEEGSLS